MKFEPGGGTAAIRILIGMILMHSIETLSTYSYGLFCDALCALLVGVVQVH